jgi:DNA gyrase/topoisomerase IV subunit A
VKLEIPTQLKTWLTPSNPSRLRSALVVVAIGGLLISVAFIYAWCSSSNVANVPAVVIEHEKNAAILNEKATADEKLANETHKRQNENQARIDEINRELEKAKRDSQISRAKLNDLENEYEKLRKAPVSVSDADLDARERQLLAKLRQQQR